MIRAFVGIPVTGAAADALEAVQAGLGIGRAVPPENFHITLAFLDSHPEPVIEDVHYALCDLRVGPLALSLSGLGVFGDARPRSLHALVRPDPGLGHLRDKVMRAARSAGVHLPRARYVPHVTIARFGNGLRGEAVTELRGFVERRIGFAHGPLHAAHFTLYQSYLAGSGAQYEPLAEYPLGSGAGEIWTGAPV